MPLLRQLRKRYKMKILFILLISLVLCVGCSTVKTTVEQPNGQTYTIVSKTDSVVIVELPDGTRFEINNQGKASAFEWFMVNALNNTDINLGDEDNN